jgi:hypothetical protein
VLSRAEWDLRSAQDPRVTLEFALLKLGHARRIAPFAELVARVEGLLSASGASPAPARRAAPEAGRPAPATAPRQARPEAASVDMAPGPPPAPPTPPPPDDAGGLVAALLALAQARPSLAQPLRGATARLEGNVLLLEVPPDFSAFAAMHLDEYGELAAKAVGRKITVRVGSGAAAASAPPEPSPAEVKRERLMKEAAREPAVQEALDLFNGKVVDVREAKPAKEIV